MIKFATIMAGGYGRRLRNRTRFLSKSMIDVQGQKLIDFSLSQLANVAHKTITVGPFKEEVIEHCFNRYRIASFILTEDRGNSWWIFNSYFQEIDSPILVLPCDLITKIDLDFIETEYERLNKPPIMIVPIHPPTSHEGDFLESDNSCVTYMGREIETNLFASGIQVINPKRINSLLMDGGSNYDSFDMLWRGLLRGRALFHSRIYPHSWYTINTEDELRYFEENTKRFYIP